MNQIAGTAFGEEAECFMNIAPVITCIRMSVKIAVNIEMYSISTLSLFSSFYLWSSVNSSVCFFMHDATKDP